ncbi:cytochrome P450 4d8 [Stomoxys calcitrans]|uniref:cytochrome P450 4d8 n=1 Tax=Stomoxys calcitrans TaxID=35570 RepID=UPI0027E30834|nr:cytochrome P450 4d8 [Stomoxys calcitrans]
MTKGGELWHSRRKIVTPAFGFKLLEGFVEIFDRQSTILLDCLGEQADGKTPFNIYPLINSFNLDVIVETSMGIQLNTQTKKGCVYTAAVEELTEIYGFRLSSLLLHFETIFSLRHPFKWLRQRKLQRIVHDFSQKVIRQRRAVLENSRNANLKDADRSLGYGNKRHYAVLDTLLQATLNGQSLADDVIREEVDKVMFAGHDTTATALSFGLHLLARHPRVQKKILEEIFQVYGELESSMRFSLMNLNELKYLECVIKEVLRLYPSVPIIARIIEQDLKYKHSTLGEGIIPAGTNFIILVNGSPTSGDSYPNPEEFFPERHENVDDGGNTNYGRPFSAGPRNCFGQKFAMYNMKVALVRIIRRYELLPLGEKILLTLRTSALVFLIYSMI